MKARSYRTRSFCAVTGSAAPVRYVAFFKTDDKLTEMVVFQPKADPFGSDPDRVCVTYTYGG